MVRKISYKKYYFDLRSENLEKVFNRDEMLYDIRYNLIGYVDDNIKHHYKRATFDTVLNIILSDRDELYNNFINLFLKREIRKYFNTKQKLSKILDVINAFDSNQKLCHDVRSIIISFIV